jgi:hypothetical protein
MGFVKTVLYFRPPIQWVTGSLSLAVKRLGREADHSPPSSAELKNARAGNFSPNHRVQSDSGAHPASYPVGTGCSFPGLKRMGREADPSPPSNAEVKECVELYLLSPIRLHWLGA